MGQSGHLLTTWTVVAAWDECQVASRIGKRRMGRLQ